MKNCKPLVVPCKVHKVGGQHDIARSDLPSPESLSFIKNLFHFIRVFVFILKFLPFTVFFHQEICYGVLDEPADK